MTQSYKEGYNASCYGKIEHRAFNPYLGDDWAMRQQLDWYDGFDAGLVEYREEMGIKMDNWGR